MLIAKGAGQGKLGSSQNHHHHCHHCCMTTIVTKEGGHKEKFPTTIIFLWLLFGLGSVYNIVIEKIKIVKGEGEKKNMQKCGTPCYDYVSFQDHLNMT